MFLQSREEMGEIAVAELVLSLASQYF